MKRILVFSILMLIFVITSIAQELTVKSFTMRDKDLSASVNRRLDNNDVPCALVKVQLAARGALFEGNVMGDVAYEASEYRVYMTAGSKRLKVKMEGYLPLEVEFADHGINALVSKVTYLLVITGVAPQGQAQEPPRQQTGWLILTSTPSEADVYLKINGVESLEGKTPFQKKLAYGSYAYRLRKNLYHDELGTAQVSAGRVELNAVMQPAYGRLRITSSPAGAEVVIEGVRESYTTPCTTDVLPSGQYRVSLSKAKYLSASRTVEVSDGAVTPVQFDLAANYADVSVSSLQGADIYLNGTRVGTTSYSADLTPGVYDFEARLASHRTAKRQVEVEANKPQRITLSPTPIYGSLDVVSEPMNAVVTIDGRNCGQTPVTIDNLLVGQHSVTIAKEGYSAETASVTIEEGRTAEVSRRLSNGRQLTFASTPSGAELYIDGSRMGTTPATLTLTYGDHTVKVKNGEAEATDRITVSATMSQTSYYRYELNASQTFTVNGVSFKMIRVDGGTFTMGATQEQGSDDAERNEKPVHSVTLSSYSIGETEVTQALWQAVMGESFSQIISRNGWNSFGIGDGYPMYDVSWDDCQTFIRKLNRLTGKHFRLPTEAEWEYAARGGSKSRGYKYSGSNTLGNVAWYRDNSGGKTHPVKGKNPNELGLYDMSGNVWEWCQDRYGSYSSGSQTNPTGSNSGSIRVYRGGSRHAFASCCCSSYRVGVTPGSRLSDLGLRLVLSEDDQTDKETDAITNSSTMSQTSYQAELKRQQSELKRQQDEKYRNELNASQQTFTVNGVSFKMIRVDGGTFTMGATPEQGSDAERYEKPAHSVTLSSYYIGETEVTQALWKAVMGSNPSYFKGDDRPVEEVSWDDCQKFLRKLSQLTGKRFRLPTEAEWEYAARGGSKSRGGKYSGSNTLDNVAWYCDNSGTHPVKGKSPNELGLYDMSGNVGELCQDWYGSYSSGPQTNPIGANSGFRRVSRGGSWGAGARYCRSSCRDGCWPDSRFNYLGLRLVLVP